MLAHCCLEGIIKKPENREKATKIHTTNYKLIYIETHETEAVLLKSHEITKLHITDYKLMLYFKAKKNDIRLSGQIVPANPHDYFLPAAKTRSTNVKTSKPFIKQHASQLITCRFLYWTTIYKLSL